MNGIVNLLFDMLQYKKCDSYTKYHIHEQMNNLQCLGGLKVNKPCQ